MTSPVGLMCDGRRQPQAGQLNCVFEVATDQDYSPAYRPSTTPGEHHRGELCYGSTAEQSTTLLSRSAMLSS